MLKEKGLKNIVVVGIYSPIDEVHRQEEQARDIFVEELGQNVNIVLSKEGLKNLSTLYISLYCAFTNFQQLPV